MVSCTALTSNTPGRAGMIAIVAFRMASSTTADMFGGVSMNTHSIPSRLAAATIPLTELTAVLIGGFVVARRFFRRVRGRCGYASLSRQGFLGFWASAGGQGRQGLLSLPALRDSE